MGLRTLEDKNKRVHRRATIERTSAPSSENRQGTCTSASRTGDLCCPFLGTVFARLGVCHARAHYYTLLGFGVYVAESSSCADSWFGSQGVALALAHDEESTKKHRGKQKQRLNRNRSVAYTGQGRRPISAAWLEEHKVIIRLLVSHPMDRSPAGLGGSSASTPWVPHHFISALRCMGPGLWADRANTAEVFSQKASADTIWLRALGDLKDLKVQGS